MSTIDANAESAAHSSLRERPAVLHGHTFTIPSGCGWLTITINVDESGAPFEIFI
jgi:hypothetical protein